MSEIIASYFFIGILLTTYVSYKIGYQSSFIALGIIIGWPFVVIGYIAARVYKRYKFRSMKDLAEEMESMANNTEEIEFKDKNE